jgi:HTH-type transcriptional regulator / antitoxin HigA
MKMLSSIKDDSEYKAALIEASYFFGNEPSPGSREAYRFESLLKSIEAYESVNYVI